jgi:hypothetical protein
MSITALHQQCMFVCYFMTYLISVPTFELFHPSTCDPTTALQIFMFKHAAGLLVMSRAFLPAAETDQRSCVVE